MRKFSLTLLLVIVAVSGFSQATTFAERFWIFGRTNSPTNTTNMNLDFFSGPGLTPYAPPVVGPMTPQPNNISSANGFEGWAVVTHPNTGALQFYTDGRRVYDDMHVEIDIDPSTPIFDELGASPSSAQPVATCVVPVCPYENFYIFSNQAGKDNTGTTNGPITYRIFNSVSQTFSLEQNLPGPNGLSNMGEGMLIIPDGDDPDIFYLITRLEAHIGPVGPAGDSRYVVYRIDPFGITEHQVIDFGPGVGVDNDGASPIMNITWTTERYAGSLTPWLGQVAFTSSRIDGFAPAGDPDGQNYVFTCDFDYYNGLFQTGSDEIHATLENTILYDCEYSPDGQLLYYATYFDSDLFQYNFNTNTNYQMGTFGGLRGGGLKLGPDDQIYHIYNAGTLGNTGTVRIGILTSPNTPLTSSNTTTTPTSNYTLNAISRANTFAYNFPEFAVSPLWSATVEVAPNDSICPGEEVILTATINSLGVAIEGYEWYYSSDNGTTYNPIPGGGTSITVDQPGQYYMVVDLAGDCEIISLPITIHEREDCCYITANSASFIYNTNTTITSDFAWDNKVYIADNVIITVDNAILDVTNVDVIFGDCAGIDFVNGAQLRSNNSVYRPCDPDGVWRGLDFYGVPQAIALPTGIINECTFKNAQRAIRAYGLAFSDIRITNNLFSNCKAGVALEELTFTRSITGNTFLTDDLVPEFDASACAWAQPDEYFGILANGCNFNENIAQNDFIAPDYTTAEFTGIEMTSGSNVNVNSNQFTNMWRGVNLINCRSNAIESNTFDIGNAFNGYQHQITLTRCISSLIRSNDVNSTVEVHASTWTGNNAGIYLSLGNSYAVKENRIEGFETGIQAERVRNTSITENEVTNCRYYGIYTNRVRQTDIFCNTIDMDVQASTDAIGIAYFQTGNGNRNIEIGSNCVFETNTAIYLETALGTGTLPEIRNNFLYNYSNGGIEIVNFNGDLGSSPSPSLDAGRNSFISNNGLGLTGDIITNGSLTSFGNFGVNFTSGTVAIAGNSVNSTASCGSQIDLANSSIGTMEICDDLSASIIGLVSNDNSLVNGFENHLETASLEQVLYALHRVKAGNNSNAPEQLYHAAINHMELTYNEELWLTYWFQFIHEDYAAAQLTLSNLSSNDADELDLIFIEGILLEQRMSGFINNAPALIADLQAIALRNGEYAHLAIAVLTALQVDNYAFYPTQRATHVEGVELEAVGNNTLTVYPNPTDGLITVEYDLETTENIILEVHDVTGKVVNSTVLNYQRNREVIDLTDLPLGVYIVSINSGGETINYAKLVKR